MRRFYVSAVNQPAGPWLLNHKSLESLEKLFNEVDSLLKEALEKYINRTAKQQMDEDVQTLELPKRIGKLQRRYNYRTKFAEVTFADYNVFKDENITGILNKVDATPSLAPLSLFIKTTQGDSENEFSLLVNSKPGSDEVDFEYRIKCLDEDIQDKIKSEIDKWVRENKSPKALQIWSNKIAALVWFFGGLAIFLSWASLNDTTIVNGDSDYKSSLKQDAKVMIEKGLPSMNKDSALFLLLKLESNYVPGNLQPKTIEVQNKLALKWLIFSSIIFCVSLIRPKTIIGIGRNYARYNLYKIWISVIYTIITGILLTIITDSIFHLIRW